MSTPSNPAAGQTASSILNALTGVAGGITLALNLGGVLVPLIKGLVLEIKQIATGSETVTYQVLIQADGAALDAVVAASTDDLNAINAELVRLGLQPLPIPPAIAPPDPGTN
jgi:hypothetical protein